MQNMKRGVRTAVIGAALLTAVGAGAKEPQFRDTITVPGTVQGGITGEHHLTFSGPVALPGVSLSPGTYIFRRPATNVLQVSNARREPYAMVMTTSATRTSKTDSYEIVLGPPLAAGSPRRIEAWFAPGEASGQQLLYRR